MFLADLNTNELHLPKSYLTITTKINILTLFRMGSYRSLETIYDAQLILTLQNIMLRLIKDYGVSTPYFGHPNKSIDLLL